MGSLNDDSNPERLKSILDTVTDLSGKPLLNLKATCKSLHDTGNLAQTGDGTVGNICHVRLSDKRHYMMFTGRIQFDILDKDHLLVFFLEHSAAKYLGTILMGAMSQELQCLGYSLGSLDEALPLGVLTQKPQDFLIVFCDGSRSLLIIFFILDISHLA